MQLSVEKLSPEWKTQEESPNACPGRRGIRQMKRQAVDSHSGILYIFLWKKKIYLKRTFIHYHIAIFLFMFLVANVVSEIKC